MLTHGRLKGAAAALHYGRDISDIGQSRNNHVTEGGTASRKHGVSQAMDVTPFGCVCSHIFKVCKPSIRTKQSNIT